MNQYSSYFPTFFIILITPSNLGIVSAVPCLIIKLSDYNNMHSINFLIRYVFLGLLIPFYASFIIGCSQDSNTTTVTESTMNSPLLSLTYSIKGRVVKGPVDSATVNVFTLDSQGKKQLPFGTTTTNPDGYYEVFIKSPPYTSISIESRGGSYTDEVTGNRVNIHKEEFLEGYFVLPWNETNLQINITPLTTIASALARHQFHTNNIDLQQAIDQSSKQIATQFGVKDISVTEIPHFSEINKANQNEQSYFLGLAGFTQLDKNDPSLSALQIISQIGKDIEQDGIWGNQFKIKPSTLSQAVKQFLASHPGTLTATLDDAIKISGIPVATVFQGEFFSFTPTVQDFDLGTGYNHQLTFSIQNKPAWATFNTATGTLSGIPTNDHLGTTKAITISVKDDTVEQATLRAFDLTVINVNDPPIFTSQPRTQTKEDHKYVYQASAIDSDMGDAVTFHLDQAPDGMLISTGGLISWTPDNDDVGVHNIVISASDNSHPRGSTQQKFALLVENVNDNPIITSTPLSNTVAQGTEFLYQPAVYDADANDSFSFVLDYAPQGMVVDTTTGKITWTPSSKISGKFDVRLRVMDQAGTTGIQDLEIYVVIPQLNWKLKFVDSEETTVVDGRAILAFDNDINTFWQSRASRTNLPTHEIQIDLGALYEINSILYQPRTDTRDGMISHYQFYISDDGVNWGEAAISGKFVKAVDEQYAKLDAPNKNRTGRYIRLVVLKTFNEKLYTSIAELNLMGVATNNHRPIVTIESPTSHISTITTGDTVTFTSSTKDVDNNSPFTYSWNFGDPAIPKSNKQNPGPVQFNNPGTYTIALTVKDAANQESLLSTRIVRVLAPNILLIPRDDWRVTYADSEEKIIENGAKENILDNDGRTIWHTEWFYNTPKHPHEIRIDFGRIFTLDSLLYLPRQDGASGRLADFEIYVSNDGVSWGLPIAQGTLTNSKEEITIPLATVGRHIRFVSTNEVGGNEWAAISELNVTGQ